MKVFFIKNKHFIIISFILLIIIGSLFIKVFGMEEYEEVPFKTGIVDTDYLNMRSGAGITFSAIDLLRKNEYVRIFGKIGDWYIIQNEENKVGAANTKNIKEVDKEKAAVTNSEIIEEEYFSNLTEEENELLAMINLERTKNNLPELKIDEALQNVSKTKAQDLVKNNYFSHTSPTYGTPFEMLRDFNITYKTASENIAGNSNIKSAFEAWMNSESHKNNILSNEYNYTGLAIENSIAYGKIIVEFFIGR